MPWPWPYALCFGATLALLMVLRGWPVGGAEPLLLRWLRCCAEHPFRTLGALALLAYALRPRRSAT